jgi:hypothetical protein
MAYVKQDGTARLRIIAPGWGSSGYYSEAVLRNAAPLFSKGVKGFWDHPTAQEEASKPEGSLSNLSHELIEDAQYVENDPNGPGLYANVRFFGHFKDAVNELGPYIGNSIRAAGKVKMGEMDGRKGPIIEAINTVKSVDMVTMPGAKGKPIELFEAARNGARLTESGEKMTDEKDVKPNTDEGILITKSLQESIAKMNVRYNRIEATNYVSLQLTPLKVKESVKARIQAAVLRNIPLNEYGEIDTVKLDESIKTEIDAETTYLNSVGAFGQITGFGESGAKTPEPVTIEAAMKRLDESLNQLV